MPGDFGAGWASTAFDRQSVVGIFAQVSRRCDSNRFEDRRLTWEKLYEVSMGAIGLDLSTKFSF